MIITESLRASSRRVTQPVSDKTKTTYVNEKEQ